MRYAIAFFLVCFALAMMTACGNGIDDVKRDAEFTKTCKDSGGHVWYDGLTGGIHCSFEATP